MIKSLQIKKKRLVVLALSLLTIGYSSCKKGNEVEPEPETPSPGHITTGVYTIKNLVADSTATFATGAQPMYYSIEEQKFIPESQAQTSNWDICFNGTYNSNICANNGSVVSSPGYGGPGKGEIFLYKSDAVESQYYDEPYKILKAIPQKALFDQAFNEVKSADIAQGKWINTKLVGLDYFIGVDEGWAYYDFYGVQFANKPVAEVSHVCYSLPRVIILKTAKGNYAKLVIYSLYKDAPLVPDRNYKPGFITMKYAIQKNGTTNLDIN